MVGVPLLALDVLEEVWGPGIPLDSSRGPEADSALEGALEADREGARGVLGRLIEDPQIDGALRGASADQDHGLRHWRGCLCGDRYAPGPDCAPRSANGSASIIPTNSLPTSGLSQQSTQQRRLGSITNAGPTHARRLLVEAAYHYRRGPVVGEALEGRQRGHAPEIINISWNAQRRLNARWRQVKDARRKPGGVVAVAIAPEPTSYCWEIATCPTALEPTPTPTTRKRLTNSP